LLAMGNNMILTKAIINIGLEYGDMLSGNLCPPESSDEFLCFTTEHGSSNDFNPTTVMGR